LVDGIENHHCALIAVPRRRTVMVRGFKGEAARSPSSAAAGHPMSFKAAIRVQVGV
jgi:hypothetical protein